jgi:protein-disulfide isomerase
MVDAILKDNKGLSPEKFEALAKSIGLDINKYNNDLAANDAEYEEIISEDMVVVSKLGVRGTPTYYIGGRSIRARDFNSYKQLVDGILSGKYDKKSEK